MGRRYPPLEYRDIRTILTRLGFIKQPRKATSHEQWINNVEGRLYKVTVSRHRGAYGHELIASMAKQAGVSKRQFYAALFD